MCFITCLFYVINLVPRSLLVLAFPFPTIQGVNYGVSETVNCPRYPYPFLLFSTRTVKFWLGTRYLANSYIFQSFVLLAVALWLRYGNTVKEMWAEVTWTFLRHVLKRKLFVINIFFRDSDIEIVVVGHLQPWRHSPQLIPAVRLEVAVHKDIRTLHHNAIQNTAFFTEKIWLIKEKLAGQSSVFSPTVVLRNGTRSLSHCRPKSGWTMLEQSFPRRWLLGRTCRAEPPYSWGIQAAGTFSWESKKLPFYLSLCCLVSIKTAELIS